MNNDTNNNNLNGTVLGNVDNNQNINSNTGTIDNIETLDDGIKEVAVTNSQNLNNNVVQNSNTFFNNPPINDMNNSEVSIVTGAAPQAEPSPAYTNPQTINPSPNSMPGFESSGAIGTTPPISLEPEKQPKKKNNKILFVIIILVVLAGVGFGTYYVLNYTNILNKEARIEVTTKNLEININESLSTNISDYASITGTDSRNCSLNITNVNISVEGEYEFIVTCGETIKKGKITVIDNNELVVETKTVYKTKGSELEVKEFIKNVDKNVTYEFVDAEAINNILNGEEGTYTVKIKAVAKNNKTVEIDGKLVLMKSDIKGYLTCSSNEQNVNSSSAVMTVSEKFVILDDENNSYGNIATEIHTFKFTDETEYSNLLATYRTENIVTINNITGDAEFDDDNLTITMTKQKENEAVINEFGESNLKSYDTIRKHFINTLCYKCVYKNRGFR